jgi:hypothetical protein
MRLPNIIDTGMYTDISIAHMYFSDDPSFFPVETKNAFLRIDHFLKFAISGQFHSSFTNRSGLTHNRNIKGEFSV